MPAVGLEQVVRGLRYSFQQDTSESPEIWTETFASTGHCHVVSLLLKELFGGYIVRGIVNGSIIHYWNIIDDVSIDATFDQFTKVESITDIVDATFEIPNETTAAKLDILWRRLMANLIQKVV